MDDERQRLVPLGEARDYEVSRGLPDVRGWPVLGSDGDTLGRVRELLIDPDAGRARYLVVDASSGVGASRPVHVPIGLARIDRERDAVVVPTVTTASLLELTSVDGDIVTREYEVHVRRSIAGGEAADLADDERFYDHEHYDERRFAAPMRDDDAEQEPEDFAYLAGVGGAMTERDEHPDVVGEVDAGQISVPVMEEESDGPVAPEDGTAGGEAEPERR
ncbi:MAG TPA: PRC-barrel domain-containing protein [Gemmatimonadaceae bacterium]|nr:PRC-barrel domain-containing protein [Gemmatimonadaceae bacterium]